jgi:DNA-binding NtrC family response regulator
MKGNILIVDDQPNWRELLSVILTDDGHKVTTATNFQEAVDLLKRNSFDIAILDMRLVDASSYNIQGMEVLKEAKKQQPSIKAIILTGYPDHDQKEKAVNFYKADGYYEKAPNGKPFDIEVFSKEIFKLLNEEKYAE